jgi:hypothetical protein
MRLPGIPLPEAPGRSKPARETNEPRRRHAR